MNKKAFAIKTLVIVLFYLFGWVVVVMTKIKETYQEARVFKGIRESYQRATKKYVQMYQNDFDVDKIDKAREEEW